MIDALTLHCTHGTLTDRRSREALPPASATAALPAGNAAALANAPDAEEVPKVGEQVMILKAGQC